MKTAKRIEAYTHRNPQATEQQPDTAPGPYYVSVKDGEKVGLLAGPFNTHQEALNTVEAARTEAEKHDCKAFWYSYGTVRMQPTYTRPGILNKLLGIT